MSSSRLVVDAIRDACRGTRYDGVVAGKIATPSLKRLVEIEVLSLICRLGIRTENDLCTAQKYLVLRRTMPGSAPSAMRIVPGFQTNAVINFVGLIPFGCVFCACFFQMAGLLAGPHSCRSPGIVVSTLIELARTHLATRDYTMSELLNNNLLRRCHSRES